MDWMFKGQFSHIVWPGHRLGWVAYSPILKEWVAGVRIENGRSLSSVTGLSYRHGVDHVGPTPSVMLSAFSGNKEREKLTLKAIAVSS